MDENESGSDSTSSTLTLNSVVDVDGKAKDGAAATVKGEPNDSVDKRKVNAQKLSDEVDKVRKISTRCRAVPHKENLDCFSNETYHCIRFN